MSSRDLKLAHFLHCEYLVVEVTLELFIGQVDAKLLKAVPLEVLEAKDVQDADVEVVL